MPAMGAALGVTDANDAKLVISLTFLGLGAGQLLAGPLSDSFGRKPVIFGFLGVFGVGSVISLVEQPSLQPVD